jgi:hypothetical protein
MTLPPRQNWEDPENPPSLYDGQEASEPWFAPDLEPEDAPALPQAQGPRDALFDPEVWLQAQGHLSGELAAVAQVFGRLDLRLSQAGEGMRLRLALQEVAELGWLTGAHLGLERLALFVALRVGAGEDSQALTQAAWAVRRLTGGAEPGAGGWHRGLVEFLGFEAPSLQDLADTMTGTERLHPFTRAALLLQAWNMAGAERAARDVEAAVLAARHGGGAGRGALFLPLALGGGGALRGRGPVVSRLAAFYRGAEQAGLSALMLIDRVAQWQERSAEAVSDLSGRTPRELLAVFARWPMVTAPMAEAHSAASRAAVQRNLELLTQRGLIREITGQGRYRVWTAKV